MACRLDGHVVSGEIFNTTNYSVHGWLEVRGWNHPLLLQLTGNCSDDLAGWHFRFESRSASSDSHAEAASPDLETLATQQVGPTGRITMVRRGDTARGNSEAVRPESCPDCPSVKTQGCLYLEWFSQNGRIVVEIADSDVEFVEFQELNVSGGGEHGAALRPEEPGEAGDSPESDEAELTASGDLGDGESFFSDAQPADDDDDEEEDPYDLFPRDLQLQLDLQASQTDWDWIEDEDKSRAIREMELMDDLIENSPGVVLSDLFDNPVKCPLPDELDDEQVEKALKSLLAELALFGIAMDVCPHFTPREVYRLLLHEVCQEERAYPELRNTQWVQHYSTSDYCKLCQAEFDQEFDDRESDAEGSFGELDPDEDDLDEDLPF